MDKKILVALVKKEAHKLKKNLTKKESLRLSFDNFRPDNPYFCIYGLAVGHCQDKRAHTLINRCCGRIFVQPIVLSTPLNECVLNGKPNLNPKERDRSGHFSPIECFIFFEENQINGNNKMLISYLKGDRKTLKFKKF